KLDKLREKLNKLEKQKIQQAKEIKNEPVLTEKTKKIAVMEETKKEISK
ncbi:15717_t:CDS:1, partial [Gigaspora margarita]